MRIYMLNTSKVLQEAKMLLDNLAIPFCLFLGTALGAYRDGHACPGDEDDVDLAIDYSYYDRKESIKLAFNIHGFDLVHDFVNKDNISPELSFKKEGVKIDLFFLSDLNGQKCWRFYLNDKSEESITKYVDKKHFESFDKAFFY